VNIEIFCLCKAVQTNDLNQPTLIDIFDKKIAAGQPVLIDPFVVVASIRFYKAEIGIHRFDLVARDSDGAHITSQSEIVSISNMMAESTTYFLQGHFPPRVSPFGVYWFSIESGEKTLAKTPLYVVRDKPEPAPRF
jgi:hypothetical protein